MILIYQVLINNAPITLFAYLNVLFKKFNKLKFEITSVESFVYPIDFFSLRYYAFLILAVKVQQHNE